jgi:predicted amidohydrolase YtcJ
VAVNRWAYGEEGPAGSEPFLPEQALDLETAFAAYTSGSAWVNHRDDAGTLSPGQVADLVVLDRDPFAGEPGEIGAAQVASTWVEGVPVHEC